MVENYETYNKSNQRQCDLDYYKNLNEFFDNSIGSNLDRLRAFPKYVPLPEIGRFLAKEKIFSQILNVQGSIIECGVHTGGGILTWAALSAIFEPYNHLRKVIGFDTFEGFPELDSNDLSTSNNSNLKIGGLKVDAYNDILKAKQLFDSFRPLGHIEKIQLVKGDACQTIPKFIEENKHLTVALLHLDFDIYKPTKIAIETLINRMPRGAIIVFDELNHPDWPGETQAVPDLIGVSNFEIKRFTFQPQISYAIL